MTATRERVVRGSAPAAGRDPFFDNAKALLIVLVVLGHNWFFAIDTVPVAKAAYVLVYTFHMPAFALLCGVFSRRFEGTPDQIRKLITTVLVPYMIFQVLNALQVAWVDHHAVQIDLGTPIYVCWFLLALFFWRITAPFWRAVRWPLAVALVVSLAAGLMIRSDAFAISRAAQLLPWFVAGEVLGPERFGWLRERWARFAGLGVMAVAAVAAWFVAPSIDVIWLDRQQSAGELHVGPLAYIGDVLLLDAATAVLVLAALALVPASRSWLTTMGAATMYPFLLHALVTRQLNRAGVHDLLTALGVPGVLLITLMALAIAFALASPPVRRLTGWAVEPRWIGRMA